MPNNFAHIGLILATMPNAKIIDARRYPLDSCIGCYKQHFARGQTYTYDLFELAEFYLEYDEMMSHWQKVAPDRVCGFNTRTSSTSWRTKFGEYWTTASCRMRKAVSIFIRPSGCANGELGTGAQPIYSGSIGTWQRFEKHITPLIRT